MKATVKVMKKMLSLLLPCLVTWIGCAAEVDGVASAAGQNSGTADISDATAAFSSCTVIGRRNVPNGFVETLICDGVGCMRTCFTSNVGAQFCTMKCENGPQLPREDPILDLSTLRPECRIQPVGRVNAGFKGISKSTCESTLASCFDNRTRDPRFPWCYEPMGKQPTCGGLAPASRIDAGFPGISGEVCIRNLGACFDDSILNVPWCFQRP